MRRVLISPHPDDAVWSCGGCLRRWVREGDDLLVVTIFDGDAGNDPSPALRRAEDKTALRRWPIAAESLGFPDAALRAGGTLYPGPLARRHGIHAEDCGTTESVAEALRPVLHGANIVLVPLAQGTHVDHEIARLAAAAAAPQGTTVRCYEEFPYRLRVPRHAQLVGEQPADVQDWLHGALAYASQVQLMFGSSDAFVAALQGHAGGGVWREWA